MRRRAGHFKFLIILALATVSLSAGRLHGNERSLPTPTRLVSDTAGVLNPEEVERLEARLQRLRDSGAAEAIIYIVPSLPEETVLEELTFHSVEAWGIGDAATDNGIALFAFIKDRKVRIEVGLGLEARISDAAASAIIQQRIAPAFRAGKYAEGLTAAIEQIELLLRAKPAATQYITTRLGATRRIAGPANAPRVTRRVFPRYPDEARRARTEGVVHLEVLINSAGGVAEVTVTKGLTNGLNEAAMTAVKQWVFEPHVNPEGKPVPALVDVVIMFRL